MRLRLDDLGPLLPPATAADEADGSRVITAPPMVLILSPLTPLPGPPEELGAQAAASWGHEGPPDCSVRVVADSLDETAVGWPLRLVHAQVVDAAGTVVEERLGAVYQFLGYTATALLRISRTGAESPPLPPLMQLLRSGRPDWRAGSVGIAALWEIWQAPA